MAHTKLDIPDVISFEPRAFPDDRGHFFESFNAREFERATGCSANFVQDNQSLSEYGVLRGLHFQKSPMAQGKLVRVVIGEIFDVAVDIRPGSTTAGRWCGQVLSAQNRKQLWVPEGFAHGFLTLSLTAEVLYKTTSYYAPELEGCIRWDDPDIAVQWPEVDRVLMSEKDRNGGRVSDILGSLRDT